MSSLTITLCSLLYLSILFGIAFWAERRSRQGGSLLNSPYFYALSLAVYCTAWTFYGSVGRAASGGIEFLSVYIGPTLTVPLWWSVLRKIIRICKVQRITSIADFISARYGKNRGIGVMITILCVIGIIPYISIQLKAIAESFAVLSGQSLVGPTPIWLSDQSFYMTLILAAFTILFGTRKLEATERHEGLVTAIAFESVIKLIAFVAVGVYVTYGLFDGPADIFGRAGKLPELRQHFVFHSGHSTTEWLWYIVLSMPAILFLPRQFQVAVVENVDERHLNKAMWLFPLYMFVICLFVLPLAFGGKLILNNPIDDADVYVLSLPLHFGEKGLALLAYIGGFSAGSSMIIVETTALSVMISNNLVMPLLVSRPSWQKQIGNAWSTFVINIRRLAILGMLLLAYEYYREVSHHFSLVSVGMMSFAAVAQFTPAIIGGIYWKRGSQAGARLGLILGASVWFYTLIVPTLVTAGLLPAHWMTEGPMGQGWLRPYTLFGLQGFDPISHSVFWSFFVNIGGYVWGSLYRPQSPLDHNQAVLFVDVFEYARRYDSSVAWKGKVLVSDLNALLTTFFGEERATRAMERYMRKHQLNTQNYLAESRLVNYTEKLLAGAVGTASARILISSVAKEEPIALDEVIKILKVSHELLTVNKELRRKSIELEKLTAQLQEANELLKAADQQKDDFLSTVTHEIRTPITAIRALSEILHDNDEMDQETRRHFLGTIIKESERLTRLINQVLDLERIESGRNKLLMEPADMAAVIQDAVESVEQLATDKRMQLEVVNTCPDTTLVVDRDRIMQVLINLLSNAIKFCEEDKGHILVRADLQGMWYVVAVADNGHGIDPRYHALIFEKFYQTQDRNTRKPKGSGLGLAITRKILELHNGSIEVESRPDQGATFIVRLPLTQFERLASVQELG